MKSTANVLLSLVLGLSLPVPSLLRAAEADSEPRTPWTTSRVKGSPDPQRPYRAERVFPNLQFNHPTVLTNAPGTNRLFVAEQSGNLFSIPARSEVDQADLFLDARELAERLNQDLDPAEQVTFGSVYGLTFHPQFETNRRCFLCYVVRYRDGKRGPHPHGTRVVELLVEDDGAPRANPQSEVELLTWLQGGHNGGCLKFGPDGMLYISAGDGASPFPPDTHTAGQDLTSLLSTVMRIDVDRRSADKPYAIPADNPFLNDSGLQLPSGTRPEIWAYGMRNPWKMSFDRDRGDLWVGDVGWELWELVYRVQSGDNFGWSLVEGRQPIRPEQTPGPTPVKSPTIEIPHTEAASVTGGFVYRGKRLPELRGHYVFGDWETRRIWGVEVQDDQVGPRRELMEPTVRIVGFGERNDGELLLLDYDDGTIHQLVRNDRRQHDPAAFPRRLSQTGLFESVASHTPAAGVLPFSVNASAWADHATSEYWLGLPDQGSVTLHPKLYRIPGSMFRRSIDFPKDAVLMKTLSLELKRGDARSRRRIETQLLHYNGQDWRGYSYRWNQDQTDAELVPAAGSTREFEVTDDQAPGGKRQQTWRFASRLECIRCHNPWSQYALAFNPAQLNCETDGTNQLQRLYEWGVLRDATPDLDSDDPFAVAELPPPPSDRPRLVDPHDTSADLDHRARSYLHVNCASCHRTGGGGRRT